MDESFQQDWLHPKTVPPLEPKQIASIEQKLLQMFPGERTQEERLALLEAWLQNSPSETLEQLRELSQLLRIDMWTVIEREQERLRRYFSELICTLLQLMQDDKAKPHELMKIFRVNAKSGLNGADLEVLRRMLLRRADRLAAALSRPVEEKGHPSNK